jgi:hypothetical protein
VSPSSSDEPTLRAIRRLLAVALLLGMVGTAAELLLIGHYEAATQYAPLVLLAIGFVLATWHLAAPAAAVVFALRLVMWLFIASGGVGVVLHANGNQEFEREIYPTLAGSELVWKTLTGATPVLAPGSMTLLGLIGLAHTHRHPAARHVAARSLQE